MLRLGIVIGVLLAQPCSQQGAKGAWNTCSSHCSILLQSGKSPEFSMLRGGTLTILAHARVTGNLACLTDWLHPQCPCDASWRRCQSHIIHRLCSRNGCGCVRCFCAQAHGQSEGWGSPVETPINPPTVNTRNHWPAPPPSMSSPQSLRRLL